MKGEFNNCSIIHSNISLFLTTLPPRGISSKTFLVSRHGLFFAVENLQNVEDLHRAFFWRSRIGCILPTSPGKQPPGCYKELSGGLELIRNGKSILNE